MISLDYIDLPVHQVCRMEALWVQYGSNNVSNKAQQMAYRPRKAEYIKVRAGRYYYRRAIPESHRELFGGKTEWVIALTGLSATERHTEAQVIAARHNLALSMVNGRDVEAPSDAAMIIIDLKPEGLPLTGPQPEPVTFLRNGRVEAVHRYAVTDDARLRRQAESDGLFVMSQEEARNQLNWQSAQSASAEGTAQDREIAELKGQLAARKIEDAAAVSSETLLSVLPRWRERKKQSHSSWRKHVQYVEDFAALHGDLALSAVTARHVDEYISHAQAQTFRGEPLSPTSITKRLDTIKALMAFAKRSGYTTTNPATDIAPPKDTRPKVQRSWKALTLPEVRLLVAASSARWAVKSPRRHDMATALQILIWSGARGEEACQLRRSDVDLERRVLRITDTPDDDEEDDARPRLMKNANSVREVPIHSALQPIIAEHLKRHSSHLLFPSFEPKLSGAAADSDVSIR
ncbi:hypothetical protein FAZ78_19290 [Cereibacter changlensis]|uniref:Core-binding (CB) domain-containing protein n=2 Tax=Cereibacter changlensis TaxID=402884 RepID=A0A4U0YTP0_9RHOB|nr:hypothetical protein FAZ78_19290 [Cereibacter changlensis]